MERRTLCSLPHDLSSQWVKPIILNQDNLRIFKAGMCEEWTLKALLDITPFNVRMECGEDEHGELLLEAGHAERIPRDVRGILLTPQTVTHA